jgi:hypothetical protein
MLTDVSQSCSCSLPEPPSPTLLPCVLFWNFQFSYKQSTLSTACFCTFWNGALRQINENKHGRVPIKILQTVSSVEFRLRQLTIFLIYWLWILKSISILTIAALFLLAVCSNHGWHFEIVMAYTLLINTKRDFFFWKSGIFSRPIGVLKVNKG